MTSSNKSLRVLSLGENLISDIGCNHIAELLDVNSTSLKELRLNWNQIMAKGSIMIANAIKGNNQLRVLDLSWNSCGSGNSHPIEVG